MGAGGARTAREFLDGLGELPVLGTVTSELLGLLAREDVSALRVARLLARDPLLTAKVLRLAKSSFYGGFSTPNLDQALVRIGMHEVRNVVLTSSVVTLFADAGPALDLEPYWRHCVASGIASHRIALRSQALRRLRPEAEGFYVSGLLHHLGVVLHTIHLGGDYGACRALCRSEGVDLSEAERRVLGFDHAESAACLLERWGFPPDVHTAVRFHHRPEEAPEASLFAARTLHVAAMLCHALQGGEASWEGNVGGVDPRSWSGLGFEPEDTEAVQSQVALAVKTAENLVEEIFR